MNKNSFYMDSKCYTKFTVTVVFVRGTVVTITAAESFPATLHRMYTITRGKCI